MWRVPLPYSMRPRVQVPEDIGLPRRRDIEVDGGNDKVDMCLNFLGNGVFCAGQMWSAGWRVLISMIRSLDC